MRTWLILALRFCAACLCAASLLLPGCFASHGRDGIATDGGRALDASAADGGSALDASAASDSGIDASEVSDGGALACRAALVDEVHAPLAVAIGEPIPVLVRAHMGVSCGCNPRAIERFGREGGEYAGLEACECSDVDPCVDPGYEATALFEPGTTPSARAISTSVGSVNVDVVDPTQCRRGAIEVRSLRIDAPSAGLISETPAGYWAVLGAQARYCCATPRSLVVQRDTTSPFAIALEMLECVEADCACVPTEPTDWEHWHFLGPLTPGAYTLSVGTTGTMFVVP